MIGWNLIEKGRLLLTWYMASWTKWLKSSSDGWLFSVDYTLFIRLLLSIFQRLTIKSSSHVRFIWYVSLTAWSSLTIIKRMTRQRKLNAPIHIIIMTIMPFRLVRLALNKRVRTVFNRGIIQFCIPVSIWLFDRQKSIKCNKYHVHCRNKSKTIGQ